MIEQRIELSVGRHDSLVCFMHAPDAKTYPLLIALHGLGTSHTNSKNGYLVETLVQKGWAVLTPDLRFHGESSGAIEDIVVNKNVNDVRAIYAYAKSLAQVESVSLFGSSYGGMLAIICAIEQPTIPLLGLVAPVTDFAEQRGIVMSAKELRQWKQDGYFPHFMADGQTHNIKYDFYESMLPYHEKIFELAPKIQSNTFIIQGDHDESVPLQLTKDFFSYLMCDKELVVVPGADHHFSDPVQKQNMLKRFGEFYSSQL